MSGGLRDPLRKRESHLWDRHPEDWYVEPEWCSLALFSTVRFFGHIHDPACGSGNIVKSARALGLLASGADLVKRAADELGMWQQDFLEPGPMGAREWDNIVSNPPFKLCDDRKAKRHPFVEQALACARQKVALLLPANWIQGQDRSRWLETTPLWRVLFIVPRPSMPPGPALAAGMKPGNGTTDYAWFIWDHAHDGRATVGWLRKPGNG